jgi:GTP-binding protein Era
VSESTPKDFRAGFVAFLGKPNAGKSTLLNALLGEKVAAVSPRPQTTQKKLAGIYTDETRQVVLVDLPGIVAPEDPLRAALAANITRGLEGVDAVVHLIDAGDENPVGPAVVEVLARINKPVILAINKLDGGRAKRPVLDVAKRFQPPFDVARYHSVVGISALQRRGLDELLTAIDPHLTIGEPLYDVEQLVDASLRELAVEMIREKVFETLQDEMPYAVAVAIEEFTEHPEPRKVYIRGILYVERESQKGILIGAGGSLMKKISSSARREIERLMGREVYLELWVKERKNWRRNAKDLLQFGVAAPIGKKKQPKRK